MWVKRCASQLVVKLLWFQLLDSHLPPKWDVRDSRKATETLVVRFEQSLQARKITLSPTRHAQREPLNQQALGLEGMANFARAGRRSKIVPCEFRRLTFCNMVSRDKRVRCTAAEVHAITGESRILTAGRRLRIDGRVTRR